MDMAHIKNNLFIESFLRGIWSIDKWTVVHELGHVWDYWNYGLLSMNINNGTKSFKVVCFMPTNCHYGYNCNGLARDEWVITGCELSAIL